MGYFPDIPCLKTQKLSHKSLLSLQKKRIFYLRDFGKICYLACTINRAGKFICLCACLHERDHAGLIDKPEK